MLIINEEKTKYLILGPNPNRLHHTNLNPNLFLPHELSFDYPITTGTNNPIRPNNKVMGCDFIAT